VARAGATWPRTTGCTPERLRARSGHNSSCRCKLATWAPHALPEPTALVGAALCALAHRLGIRDDGGDTHDEAANVPADQVARSPVRSRGAHEEGIVTKGAARTCSAAQQAEGRRTGTSWRRQAKRAAPTPTMLRRRSTLPWLEAAAPRQLGARRRPQWRCKPVHVLPYQRPGAP
jgi:hypothetical protein